MEFNEDNNLAIDKFIATVADLPALRELKFKYFDLNHVMLIKHLPKIKVEGFKLTLIQENPLSFKVRPYNLREQLELMLTCPRINFTFDQSLT